MLGNYPFYGAEVLSATAGKVVGVVDRLPDGPIDFALPRGPKRAELPLKLQVVDFGP